MAEFAVHHEIVRAPGSQPKSYLIMLHGVFGSGANWRSLMRNLVATCPDWGAVLVDVRGHGRSLGAPAPHNLLSVANDIIALEDRLAGPVRAVVGHSLGGKLALSYAEQRPEPLEQIWVLDSSPDAIIPDGSLPAQIVQQLLRQLPTSFDKREHFLSALTAGGLSEPIAQWLGMNLRRDGDHYRLTLELDTISELLESYYQADMWHVLERIGPRQQLHLVVGTRSYVWTPTSLARLDRLAAASPRLSLHRLDAGHWLHVDAPDALLALITSAFSSPTRVS